MIEISSFVYDRIKETEFGIYFIPVDSVDRTFLESLLSRMFKYMNCNNSNIFEAVRETVLLKKDLLYKESDEFAAENGNKRSKYLSSNDWLVFDCANFTETQ